MSTVSEEASRGIDLIRQEGAASFVRRFVEKFVLIPAASAILKASLRLCPTIANTYSDITDINRVRKNGRTYGNVLSVYRIHQPWHDDAEFRSIWETAREYTMNDVLRAYTLFKSVEQTRHLDGAVVEVGTHNGGLGCLMAKKLDNEGVDATTYLGDTFSGIVKSTERDSGYDDHSLSQADPQQIRELAASLDVSPEILEGVFPDETASEIEEETIRLAHVDVDVYQSTKDAYEWLWPRLCEGGIVVIDDCGYEKADGVTQFVEEVEGNEDNVTNYQLNTQAMLVKTG